MKLSTSRKRHPVGRNAPKWSLWLVCCFSLIYIKCLYISTNETDELLRMQENTGSGPIISKNVPHSSAQWPNPTLVVGLPKVGTRTIYDYFVCGNMTRVSHYRCADNIKCGLLIYDNVVQHNPPLFGTGAYDVYTQLDITAYTNTSNNLTCYYPQVELLEELDRHHPTSTFILNQRNVTAWVKSVKRWFSLHERLIQCNITGFETGVGLSDEELVKFYNDQSRRVREFVDRHPTHRLVEVEIDQPSAGQVMEDAFGIDRSCWGHGNKADAMPILNQPTRG